MTVTKTRFDKHSGKILFTLWLFIIAGGLIAIEWALAPSGTKYDAYGSIGGPGPYRRLMLREWEPSTNYNVAPTANRLRYPNGGTRKVYEVSTDSNGFIEPALRHEKPDLNIVFMGGSTTECLFVAPENRFPYLTARKLETALDLKINGINAARSGNNGMHSLLLLLGKVIAIRPDYVVLMHAANDIGVLSQETYWKQPGSKKIIDVQKISVEQSISILSNSLLPYTSGLISHSSGQVKKLLRGPPRARANVARLIQPTDNKSKREVMGGSFASMLRSYVELARAWGITPILVTQVKVRTESEREKDDDFLARERLGGARVDPDDFATTHEYFNSIIRDVAARKNVLLVDLARDRNWSFGDVYDGIHFTDQGSVNVAELISAKLKVEISRRHVTPPGTPAAK